MTKIPQSMLDTQSVLKTSEIEADCEVCGDVVDQCPGHCEYCGACLDICDGCPNGCDLIEERGR